MGVLGTDLSDSDSRTSPNTEVVEAARTVPRKARRGIMEESGRRCEGAKETDPRRAEVVGAFYEKTGEADF